MRTWPAAVRFLQLDFPGSVCCNLLFLKTENQPCCNGRRAARPASWRRRGHPGRRLPGRWRHATGAAAPRCPGSAHRARPPRRRPAPRRSRCPPAPRAPAWAPVRDTGRARRSPRPAAAASPSSQGSARRRIHLVPVVGFEDLDVVVPRQRRAARRTSSASTFSARLVLAETSTGILRGGRVDALPGLRLVQAGGADHQRHARGGAGLGGGANGIGSREIDDHVHDPAAPPQVCRDDNAHRLPGRPACRHPGPGRAGRRDQWRQPAAARAQRESPHQRQRPCDLRHRQRRSGCQGFNSPRW